MAVHGVRAPDVGGGGDDLPSHAYPVADVIRGGVPDDQPEAGSLGARAAAGAGTRVLPDRVGDAAPVSLGDGPPTPGATERMGGGRRGIRRGSRGCRARRQTATKSTVAIAVEIKQPKGFGRIRPRSVPDVSQDSLIPFIETVAETGSTVHTDEWQAYWTVPEHGYTHERTVMRKQNDPAHVVMPGVHRVASLLQRWLVGTHQAGSAPITSTRTSTSSRSVSTADTRGVAKCCSTARSTSPSRPTRSPTAASSPTRERPAGKRRLHHDQVACPGARGLSPLAANHKGYGLT